MLYRTKFLNFLLNDNFFSIWSYILDYLITTKISLSVSGVWVRTYRHIYIYMYVCIHTCALAVYLKHVLSTLEKPFSCKILYTNLFSHAWDFSQHRGRLPCHRESICNFLELSLTAVMHTFLFMLGSFLLAEANIIQQAQNCSIVLYRSSYAEKVAASLFLGYQFFIGTKCPVSAFKKKKVVHMNISLYSQLADSLMLTFCIHCLFVKSLLHHLKL